MDQVIKFLYSFFAVVVTAVVCSYFVRFGTETFYNGLDMPPLTPAAPMFAPAWSVLYVLMIYSFYLILEQPNIAAGQNASALFLLQLLLQMIWSYLFFYSAYFLYALIVMFLLLCTVWLMIKKFTKLNKTAGYLQYPYLLWLLFATYMNAGAVYLNGNQLEI